jgi:hypothetical protein
MNEPLWPSIGNPSGIPIAEPTQHAELARSVLTTMNASYPGEAFAVHETSNGNLVVVWLPSWSLDNWLTQALSASIQNLGTGQWPGDL